LELYNKSQIQLALDKLIMKIDDFTYVLPSSPEWRGVYEPDGSDRGVFVDLVKINFSADPILTMD
jgi:hypothetical protein